MWEAAEKLWAFIGPPEVEISDIMETSDVDKIKKMNLLSRALWFWRLKVSLLTFLSLAYIAWSFTSFGVVRAGDLQGKVDAAVQASVKKAVSELQTEQTQIKADVADIKAQNAITAPMLREIVRTSIATNICRIIVRRNKEGSSAERASLRTDADVEQEKYKAIAGEYYPESRCGGE